MAKKSLPCYPNQDMVMEVFQDGDNHIRFEVCLYLPERVLIMSNRFRAVQESFMLWMQTLDTPEKYYNWLNSLPNIFGATGFSSIVPGFEPYLNKTYTKEMVKSCPVLMVIPVKGYSDN